MIAVLCRELRVAIRSLRRTPLFAGVAVVTLALGIGATAAIFGIASYLLIRPLPVRDPSRIVHIGAVNLSRSDLLDQISPADLSVLRERQDLFTEVAATAATLQNLSVRHVAEEVPGKAISPEYFLLTGFKPVLGRTFVETETRARVVILSHSAWSRLLGRDSSVVGRTLSLNGEPYEIVGVMPKDVEEFDRSEVWTPYSVAADSANRVMYLEALARIRPGVSLRQVTSALDLFASLMAREHPGTNGGYTLRAVPLSRHLVGAFSDALTALLLAVAAILLIACANVANMLLARSGSRQRDIAVRQSLGASSIQLSTHIVAEGAILAIAGVLLAGPIAVALLRLLRHLAPPDLWRLRALSVDWRVFAFGLGVAGLATILVSLAPVLSTLRFEPARLIQGSDTAKSHAFGSRGIAGALVVAEVGLSFPLLIGAGLIFESLWSLGRAEIGLRRGNLVTAEIALPRYRYKSRGDRLTFFSRLRDGAARLSGVTSVGLVSFEPVTSFRGISRSFQIEGTPAPLIGQAPEASFKTIDPGYAPTVGLPLLDGRLFLDSDTAEAPRVALISRALARKYFGGRSPVGRRLAIEFPGRRETPRIVGVVGDVASWPDVRIRPTIYMPCLQDPLPIMTLVLRTGLPASTLATAIRREVSSIDPDQPIREIAELDEQLAGELGTHRFLSVLLQIFGVLALSLAVLGTYSVISYLVELRRKEIGIRSALGASARNVVSLFLLHALRWIALGLGIGAIAGIPLAALLRSFLYGVGSTHIPTAIGAGLLLMAGGLIGALIPALRAARVDPLSAIRA